MVVRLESTTQVVTVNGVPARIWEGHTDSGIPVHAYITWIAVKKDANQAEFERELQTCRPPTPDLAIAPRLIL